MKPIVLMAAVLLVIPGVSWAETAGEKVFKQKCAMCHLVKGKGGQIGPDLTTVAGKMNETQLRSKLVNPKRSNPSSTMPSYQSLPKGEMDALVGYLKTLK